MKKTELRDSLTADRLRELIHYEKKTGVFTWRVKRPGRGARKPGDVAGYLRNNERRIISVDGENYRASRLAWLYMTGKWPVGLVDHEDGNKANDRWRNLRDATRSQNAMNSKRRSDNISGFKCVYLIHGRWCARIRKEGRRVTIGHFSTAEKAHAAYCKAAKALYGEFAHMG